MMHLPTPTRLQVVVGIHLKKGLIFRIIVLVLCISLPMTSILVPCVALPAKFSAMQVTCPASSRALMVSTKELLSYDLTGTPFLSHVISGVGIPLAWHVMLTRVYVSTVTSLPTGTSTLVLLERGIVSREDFLIIGSVGSAKSHNVKTYFE